ncbi:hypothetical protein [Mycolicibacterium nivoides]|uniref:Uncharacterized protein n=1 Tax=Mycolicibacterium nivoides TaxID=2487344 RepID=A0ABW9LLP4_9MYCO
MQLTRLTMYTPASIIAHVSAGYAAMFGVEPELGSDESGTYTTVTSAEGLTLELRPVQPGDGRMSTVTRLEFRGADAHEAADRLHDETHGVQRHLFGGRWETLAGTTIRMIADGDEPDNAEKARISAAIQRGELEAEIARMQSRQT